LSSNHPLVQQDWLMTIPTLSLKEFIRAIPVCSQASGLADVLEIFRSSGCDAIAIVTSQQFPLGIVNSTNIMPYLLESPQTGKTPPARIIRETNPPISQLDPPIIEPLAVLSAQLSLNQFWLHLQQAEDETQRWGQTEAQLFPCSSYPSSQQWALVDENQKFLGLLNSGHLLKSVAPHLATPKATHPQEPAQSPILTLLVQLLEHLPLPLSLQTTTGQVLAQNHSWRQEVGTSPNLDWVRRTTAAMLESSSDNCDSSPTSLSIPQTTISREQQQTVKPGQSILATASKPRGKIGTPVAVQHFCAIDTPRLAAAVSTQQVISSVSPIGQTHESQPIWRTSSPFAETSRASQERIFSFVKIPLSPAVFEGEEAALENQQDPNYYHPSLCDLCVVLAQDTTEQQEVAKELAAKNADLVHLNRLKDEFLACISHELKTPLTAVLGLSSLLKDKALGELNDRQSRYARLIYQSGRQLMTLVNDILDLTRMETGQLELTLEPVQIQSVCDHAYSQARQFQQEKDQEDESTPERQFILEIEPGLEMLVADELRLRQMLMHLLANALKFTDTKGDIGLRVNRWEGWIAFTVWDTGIGIPSEKQHLIFQKFQQLEQPLTRQFEGTGLGLVLTQRLARLHGGDVSFISKTGEGSQFTLLLPPCPPQVKKTETDGESEPCSIPRFRCPVHNRLVLIVETVPRYLENLTEQLESLGYRVMIARSGTEAIAKARGLQPRAIILNPLLPQLSGWDVLTLIKSDAQARHIPVLVMATQAEKQQAYQNKADGFLNLPVKKQNLLQSLTCLEQQECPTSRGLTILHLSPAENSSIYVPPQTPPDSPELICKLTDILNQQHSEFNCRVLEADDLDQAELLARVWQPDVIIIDAFRVADRLAYFQQLSQHPNLIALPLVTLDHQTTEAANQIPELLVYPCLATDSSSKIAALMQVIQVAAGISRMPSILVMDIGEQGLTKVDDNVQSKIPPFHCPRNRDIYLSSPALEKTIEHKNAPSIKQSPGRKQTATQKIKAEVTTSLAPQSTWLQALLQYLQTAGFRSVLSYSWAEIHRQIQAQSVDLLLIRVKDIDDFSEVVPGLMALAQLQKLPPILVLDHRLNQHQTGIIPEISSINQSSIPQRETRFNLDSILQSIATQFLRGHSISMTQLLEHINRIMGY
jgi:signal transduction histidine kinase/CheY-like chemotaxis protein